MYFTSIKENLKNVSIRIHKVIKIMLKVALVFWIGMTTFLGFTTLLYSAPHINADELDEINQQIKQKEERISKIESELNEILNNSRKAYSKLTLLQAKYNELQKLIGEYNQIAEKYSAELDYNIELLKQEQNSLIVERAVFYLETQGNILVYLLDAQTVNDLVDRFAFLAALEYQGANRLKELNQKIAGLAAQKEQVIEREKTLKRQAQDLRAQISNVKAEYKRLVALASQRRAQLTNLSNEVDKLSKRAEEIIRRKALANLGSDVTGGNNLPIFPVVEAEGNPGVYKVTIEETEYNVDAPLVLSFKDSSWASGKYFKVEPCSSELGQCRYYGGLLFRKDADVYVINFVPMHIYLYGLGEMPSSWHIEALKSQAVAARTYAYKKFQHPRSAYYHIVDTVADQNYIGANKLLNTSAEHASNWKTAVDSTLGQILTVGGQPITAWYHSTCGGHTLSSAEVWGGARSYAQARSDRYEADGSWVAYDKDSPRYRWFAGDTPLDNVWLEDLIDATIYYLRQGKTTVAQNQVGCGPSSCVGEYADFRLGNIKNVLGENSISAKVGSILDVVEVFNDGAGESETIGQNTRKTLRLKVIGDKGEYDIDAQAFKLVYNIRSPGENWIASTLFDVAKDGDYWKVYSYGFGHRVGLCQYGAYGRAQAGQGYDQILKHYYTGVNISSIYSSSNIPVIKVGIQRAGGEVTTVTATDTFYIYDISHNIIAEVPAGIPITISRE